MFQMWPFHCLFSLNLPGLKGLELLYFLTIYFKEQTRVFQTSSRQSRFGATIHLAERIYHASVCKVLEKHGNALLSILVTIGQTALFTLAFYLMFAVLPMRASSIRGDFFIYTMSGVFLFMAHIETVKAISASEKSTSAIMQHAPMNTAIAI